MKEVDFNFLIDYLAKEIDGLNNFKNIENLGNVPPDISVQMVNVQISYLSTLLEYVKSAVRVERDKIQGAKDYIDATLYALMSKSSVEMDDEYQRMLDHAKSNACKNFDDSEIPKKEKPSKNDYISMAESLEHLRLELQARNAENAVRKRQYICQDGILAEASEMLRDIGSERKWF